MPTQKHFLLYDEHSSEDLSWSATTIASPDRISPKSKDRDTPSPNKEEADWELNPSWRGNVLRTLKYYFSAPVVFYTSQRAQVWIGLITLSAGAFYYRQSYLQGIKTVQLARNSYQISLWKDCYDRIDLLNSTICLRYNDLPYAEVAKRGLMPTFTNRRPLNIPSILQNQRSHLYLEYDTPHILGSLISFLASIFYILKVFRLCYTIHLYTSRMTKLRSLTLRTHHSLPNLIFSVHVSLTSGYHPLLFPNILPNPPSPLTRFLFILERIIVFHIANAIYQYIFIHKYCFPPSTILGLSADFIRFTFTALLLSQVVLSALHPRHPNTLPTRDMIFSHVTLLAISYAVVKTFRKQAYESLPSPDRERSGEESQQIVCMAPFSSSPLDERITKLFNWVIAGQNVGRKNCGRGGYQSIVSVSQGSFMR